MPDKILHKDKLNEFMHKLGADHDLYAPVKQGAEIVWAPVQNSEEMAEDFNNTSMSPKDFFFPQTECMMRFKNSQEDPEGMIMQDEPRLQRKRALLNIRPCDAKAFQVLDMVFCRDEESTDPYWKDKRDKTMLIGLACNDPCSTCFCTSVNCGPHHEEGLDILLQDLGDKFLVKELSEQGKQVTADLPDAGSEDQEQAEKLRQEAEKQIETGVGMENINKREILEAYEHPAWDRVHESCLNCGTCTFCCPTCHCFDIQDETQDEEGRRVRNWDTCMSWLFTHHTTGHNPRGRKKDRVRQRFMHKFKYMPIKLQGEIGCVGCGRCIQLCPVNIDVREVVNELNK